MLKENESTYFKSSFKENYKKFVFIIFLSSFIILSFEIIKYTYAFSRFKTSFDLYNFNESKEILKENFNPLLKNSLNKNLSSYFKEKIESLNYSIETNKINPDEAFVIINEINKFNILDYEINKTIQTISNNISDNSNLTKGILEYQKGDYKSSLKSLSLIDKNNLGYEISNSYINKNKSSLKEEILKEVSILEKKEYFSKAILLIEENIELLDNDKELKNKIKTLEEKRSKYLQTSPSNYTGDSSISTSTLINSISNTSINSFWIESLTPYLIFVDQTSQKTFIYKGKVNKWSLEKEMICSTGIKGRETPSGVFDIREKGSWFFSPKYNQGGKYYTQFKGNYLFHSIPYAEDAKTIVDYTLGEPASHGCIRLKIDDAKWIYDNIPKGTKVIIN